MSLEKYVGRTLRIVYIDRNNRITTRIIDVRSVKDGVVRAYCRTSAGPRVFTIENILAYEGVRENAV